MVRDELSVLSAFLAVAEERSFTRAAKRLNVSTSGLSHAIRRLEEDLGVRLLARTTRSVSPTDAGEQLLESLRPALAEIRAKLAQISGTPGHQVGRIRLLVPRLAAGTVLAPKLGEFVRKYPDVVLDVTTDDSHVDLVAAGYDAGIQFGEYIAQDMVAVRVSPDHRPAIIGAPAYVEAHGRPDTPYDLLGHHCINFRHRGEGIYRWELAFVAEDRVTDHIASGALVRVLEDWCPPFPGFFLYYPSRLHQPAALVALIDTFRL
jgi:DNA-binding transcriptional LysR family regulator